MTLERAPCINGFALPQYYRIRGIYVGAAPRSGSTSLFHLYDGLKDGDPTTEELDGAPETATCILRNPLRRIESAWLLLPLEARRLPTERVIMRPPIEEVIDAVLGDHAEAYFTEKIGNSNHAFAWMRQSDLYSGVKYPEWIRLEGIEVFHGLKLPRANVATEEKPKAEHRLEELKDYYREDLELWERAPTKL